MNIERKKWTRKTKLIDLVEDDCTVEELFSLMMLNDVENTSAEPMATKKEPTIVRISKILQEIGMPTHLNGYSYVRSTIEMAYNYPSMLNSVTKDLYPIIASKYGTTVERLERSIRHAIECAWDRISIEVVKKYFGNTISLKKDKPANREFISKIVDILHMQDEMEKE